MRKTLMALWLIPALAPAQLAIFRVRETAGLRRFSFPVRASMEADGSALHLSESGKAVPAQFSPLGDGRMDIDFNVSIGPWETREYRVERGGGAAPVDKGVAVEQASGLYAVRHGVEFDVPDNLLGLLNQVKGSKLVYLRPGSQGLLLNYKDDIEFRTGGTGHWNAPTQARVTKRGPLVGGIRFESREGLRGDRSVKSVVDLDFPRSKSWMEVRWRVDDPERW